MPTANGDQTQELTDEGTPPAELAFGHFLVPRRADGSLWELGRGAMGVTYRAFDTSLQTEVALKVIRADRVSEDIARRRFQREARAAAKVRHPNIASVLYLGEQSSEFYYTMEFVPGRGLDELLGEANGPLPPTVAVALAAQAAAALNAAHKRELIHRDLKPANLMLLEGEHLDHVDERTRAAGNRLVKVIDFGLARSFAAGRTDESLVTQTDSGFIGTPAYASPEQGAGVDDLDGRSDLYSLGIILWQMLAGRLPFTGRVIKVLTDHQHRPPPFEQLHNVPAPLIELLNGLLAKDPAERWPQNAGELRDVLDGLVRELAAGAATVPAPAPATPALLPSAPAPAPAAPAPANRPPTEVAAPVSPAPSAGPALPLPTKVISPAPRPSAAVSARVPPAPRERKGWPIALATFLVCLLAGAVVIGMMRRGQSVQPPTPTAVLDATPLANTPTSVNAPTPANAPTPTVSTDPIRNTEVLRYLTKAKTTAYNLSDAFDKAVELSAIAAAQIKANKMADARNTLAQAQTAAEDSSVYGYFEVLALGQIAVVQARLGDAADARSTLKRTRAVIDLITTTSDKDIARSALAIAQAKIGDTNEADATATEIHESLLKAVALAHIATAQARAGNVASARATTDEISSNHYKAVALSALAAAQAVTGDAAGARETLTQAVARADAIGNAAFKVDALRAIRAAQTKTDDKTGALKTFAQMQSAADSITYKSDKLLALSVIAVAQVRMGDIVGARTTLEQTKEEFGPEVLSTSSFSLEIIALGNLTVARVGTEGFPAAEDWAEARANLRERTRCHTVLAEARLDPTGQVDTEED